MAKPTTKLRKPARPAFELTDAKSFSWKYIALIAAVIAGAGVLLIIHTASQRVRLECTWYPEQTVPGTSGSGYNAGNDGANLWLHLYKLIDTSGSGGCGQEWKAHVDTDIKPHTPAGQISVSMTATCQMKPCPYKQFNTVYPATNTNWLWYPSGGIDLYLNNRCASAYAAFGGNGDSSDFYRTTNQYCY